MIEPRTRLAPSPTGALHLGNARTFLINWALARKNDWRIVLRIEDLDTPRVKPGANQQAIDDLAWLGLDWDEGPFYQRQDLTRYHAAINRLADRGLVYPCFCTRSKVASMQSAPNEGEHDLVYPGICRPASPAPCRYDPTIDATWRLRLDDGRVQFTDSFAGPQSMDVARITGDFPLATRSGLPSYQLAVVVDDASQGITQVVRGDDLLTSAARQLLLFRQLGLTPEPTYTHLPLVVGTDGRRLAKRHGDTRAAHYREQGVPAARLIGLIASWCGIPDRREMTAKQFAESFELSALPRGTVIFTESDERWLTQR